MHEPGPFVLSPSEIEITQAMRAEGAIPRDWCYVELPWQQAIIFDRIVDIGGADLRVLSCSRSRSEKTGEIVLGPSAAQQINERCIEILALLTKPIHENEFNAKAKEAA